MVRAGFRQNWLSSALIALVPALNGCPGEKPLETVRSASLGKGDALRYDVTLETRRGRINPGEERVGGSFSFTGSWTFEIVDTSQVRGCADGRLVLEVGIGTASRQVSENLTDQCALARRGGDGLIEALGYPGDQRRLVRSLLEHLFLGRPSSSQALRSYE